jgi:pilus assembly protein Flp/PilA
VRLLFLQFLKNESAATAIEYALIAAGIALAIVTAATLVRRSTASTQQ